MTIKMSTFLDMNQFESIISPSLRTQTTSKPPPRKIVPTSPVGPSRTRVPSPFSVRKTVGRAPRRPLPGFMARTELSFRGKSFGLWGPAKSGTLASPTSDHRRTDLIERRDFCR